MNYDFQKIEAKWQGHWEKHQTFKTKLEDTSKPKYYVLDMFPYPSASGLHVGHVEGYTASDIVARYKRAKGFNVLHPMGWDAFGLPAEQYALATGVHPAITTNKAIDNFRSQLKNLGLSYDWTCELSTCDPKYYKWTQFIFLKLLEKGLIYRKEVPVNWCPELKTVLANEEVVDGKSERGGHPVFRIPMKQWMIKITAYADRLLKDLDKVDWPDSTKEAQRNWIGRSEGLQLKFALDGQPAGLALEVFTTRPDTLFGVTFMAIAPEHPLLAKITTAGQKAAVEKYVTEASQKSELARQDLSKQKTGVFTGTYAVNPVNGAKVPVWVADYVLMGYGTGAIMAVPAHDERDLEFAKSFNLLVIEVNKDGHCMNSHSSEFSIDGLTLDQGKNTVIQWAEKKKIGEKKIQYKLRDWLFSRQRYWGEPIPVVYSENDGEKIIPENLKNLPVELPNVKSYEPMGTAQSPLAGVKEWREFLDGESKEKRIRETDTMPGSAGSSWYFLRYIDAHNGKEPFSKAREKHWLPVDLYLGGPEHSVGHLLYSRFWMKFLFDIGLVSHDEPFQKLVHQGMILGEDGEKMSKSRGNVVNPDDVIQKFGTDSLRLYEMFMGPLDKEKPWSTAAIDGVHRFLHRAWRVMVGENGKCLVQEAAPSAEAQRLLHKTIKKVTESLETLRFNTAISHLMVLVNFLTKSEERPREILKPFVQMLQPLAPHIAEELWEMLGEKSVLPYASWPEFQEALAKDEAVTVAVQFLGKTRGTLELEPGQNQEAVEKAVKESGLQRFFEGKTVRKVIYIQDKIINFVVN